MVFCPHTYFNVPEANSELCVIIFLLPLFYANPQVLTLYVFSSPLAGVTTIFVVAAFLALKLISLKSLGPSSEQTFTLALAPKFALTKSKSERVTQTQRHFVVFCCQPKLHFEKIIWH